MLGLLIPLFGASTIAAWRVGSFAGLQSRRIDWWPLALASIAAQLVLFNPPIDRQPWALEWGPWVWVASLITLVAVLMRNALSAELGRAAFVLGALGVGLNLMVVLANGGHMPQSPEARLAVRGTPLIQPGAVPQLHNVAASGPDTRFTWLGDVFPEPAWLPTANVVSVGDLMLSTALAWWAFRAIISAPSIQVRGELADSK
jgi:Family of unknown function (DUF5317)